MAVGSWLIVYTSGNESPAQWYESLGVLQSCENPLVGFLGTAKTRSYFMDSAKDAQAMV